MRSSGDKADRTRSTTSQGSQRSKRKGSALHANTTPTSRISWYIQDRLKRCSPAYKKKWSSNYMVCRGAGQRMEAGCAEIFGACIRNCRDRRMNTSGAVSNDRNSYDTDSTAATEGFLAADPPIIRNSQGVQLMQPRRSGLDVHYVVPATSYFRTQSGSVPNLPDVPTDAPGR